VSLFLDPDALTTACLGGRWQRLDGVATTGSTNADLGDAARAGAPAGTVLVSAHQSTGRGRFRRRWEAPPGTSIACSVLVEPRRPASEWGWLPLLVGMGVADGVRAATGLATELKWPNDVLVDGRKLSGILCESVPVGDRALAVLGMGVNVSLTTDQLPVPTATSIRLAGSDVGATAVTAAILASLEGWLDAWDAGADPTAEYRLRCATLGWHVEVHGAGGVRAGRAVDVDSTGGLVVEVDGRRATFLAGDVVHLRRA